MEDSNDTSSIDFLPSSVPVGDTESTWGKTEVVENGGERDCDNPVKESIKKRYLV
jgi:hypothetical protein